MKHTSDLMWSPEVNRHPLRMAAPESAFDCGVLVPGEEQEYGSYPRSVHYHPDGTYCLKHINWSYKRAYYVRLWAEHQRDPDTLYMQQFILLAMILQLPLKTWSDLEQLALWLEWYNYEEHEACNDIAPLAKMAELDEFTHHPFQVDVHDLYENDEENITMVAAYHRMTFYQIIREQNPDPKWWATRSVKYGANVILGDIESCYTRFMAHPDATTMQVYAQHSAYYRWVFALPRAIRVKRRFRTGRAREVIMTKAGSSRQNVLDDTCIVYYASPKGLSEGWYARIAWQGTVVLYDSSTREPLSAHVLSDLVVRTVPV